MRDLETRYLERLSDLYPTIAAASTEIINLQAILNLPKGTEHFLTDIHGEYEAFSHVLKNGSGAVRRKIDEVFGNTMSARDKQNACNPDLLSEGKDGHYQKDRDKYGGLVQGAPVSS